VNQQSTKDTVVNIYTVPAGAAFKRAFRETFACKMQDRVQDIIDRIGRDEFTRRVRALACIVVERSDKPTRTYDIPWYQDKVDASLHRTMDAVAHSIQVTAKRRMAYLARRNMPLVKMRKLVLNEDNLSIKRTERPGPDRDLQGASPEDDFGDG
jgi:hypothetical protein